MLLIITLLLALALIYVIKAGAVMLAHEDLAQKSASFSWVRGDSYDESETPIWATGEPDPAAEAEQRRVAAPGLRRVNA